MRPDGLLVLLLGLIAGCAPIPAEDVRPFEDYSDWLVFNDLSYRIGDTEFKVVVPAGFVTDYASIPRAFCHFLPEHGGYSRPAIVHDYLRRGRLP